MSDRYVIVDGSPTAHCCFECAVIDTMNKDARWDSQRTICECMDREDAERIALAMNKLYDPSEREAMDF